MKEVTPIISLLLTLSVSGN